MYSRANKPIFATLGFALIGLAGSVVSCWADPVNTAGRFRVEGAFVGGEGTNKSRLVTANESTVRISGGGGLGARLTLGYGLTPTWDVEMAAEYKQSHSDQATTSTDTTFTRYPVLAT